jgi:polysaccharide export outer membrane protein
MTSGIFNKVSLRVFAFACFPALSASLTGCAMFGAAGPSTHAINRAERSGGLGAAGINVIDVTDILARRLDDKSRPLLFSTLFDQVSAAGSAIGRGDVLEISIFEAPPAVLFSPALAEPGASVTATSTVSRSSVLPDQMVGPEGTIIVPFAGAVPAVGRTPQQVASDIVRRLNGKANQPQVLVRRIGNATTGVTVVGDVTNSVRLPLTAKGEKLLDALAAAGGTKQAIGKMTLQITRGSQVASLPLDFIIRNPDQNIRLQADDVVTVLYQPYSFTALGAVGNNAEINFESTGITLSQALGRIGGLQDNRADIKGVFIFRQEDPANLEPLPTGERRTTPDGKVPVIYRVDLHNPASLFIAQTFPIHNKDVLYVSNAPGVDFQKFANIVSSTVFSIVNIGNAVK